jgi:hypothetical protein
MSGAAEMEEQEEGEEEEEDIISMFYSMILYQVLIDSSIQRYCTTFMFNDTVPGFDSSTQRSLLLLHGRGKRPWQAPCDSSDSSAVSRTGQRLGHLTP